MFCNCNTFSLLDIIIWNRVIFLNTLYINVSLHLKYISSIFRLVVSHHQGQHTSVRCVWNTKKGLSFSSCFIHVLNFEHKLTSTFFFYFADRASQYIYLNVNQLDALNFIMSLFHASTCFEHMCSSSGGQNCTIQPLVSSHWNKWVI